MVNTHSESRNSTRGNLGANQTSTLSAYNWKMANEFAYSLDDMQSIVESLGANGQTLLQWSEQFTIEGKGDGISSSHELAPLLFVPLEGAARRFVYHAAQRRTLSQKEKAARQIASLARHIMRLNNEFGLLSHLEKFDEPGWHQMAVETIANGGDQMIQHEGELHSEDPSHDTRNPKEHFVIQVANLFWTWTERFPGGSKEGGPAARFLCACFNPVDRYARRTLNLELFSGKGEGRSKELQEATAGLWINRMKTQIR